MTCENISCTYFFQVLIFIQFCSLTKLDRIKISMNKILIKNIPCLWYEPLTPICRDTLYIFHKRIAHIICINRQKRRWIISRQWPIMYKANEKPLACKWEPIGWKFWFGDMHGQLSLCYKATCIRHIKLT